MSLKKIAQMTGTSISTVSRVLNNTSSSCASQEVKDKIWAAAQQIQYVPNSSAKALKKGASVQSIPQYSFYIVLGRISNLNDDPFFYELYRCLQNHIFKNSYVIAGTLTLQDKLPPIQANQGFIILGRCPLEYVQTLKKKTKNIIGIWRNASSYEIDEILCDGEKAAHMAVEYLLEHHHTSIAYIGDCSYESRYVGYCRALMEHHIPFNHSIIFSTDQTKESGFHATKQLFQSIKKEQEHPCATALLCANDITAIGVLDALKTYPKKLREQFAIISIDDIDESGTTKPMLTTIHIPRNEMAHMALKILTDRISGYHLETLRVEFPPRLIVRDSCPPNLKEKNYLNSKGI